MEPTVATSPRLTTALDMLRACVLQTGIAVAQVEESRRFAQAGPGRPHPLWLLGHLVVSADAHGNVWVLNRPRQAPVSWVRLFSPDIRKPTPITPNPDDYPPWDEVWATYLAVYDGLVDSLEGYPAELLDEPLIGRVPECFRVFYPTNGYTIASLVIHDSYHRGQIAMLGKVE